MKAQGQVQSTRSAWIALFVACAFASAFLIFLVQPMVGKRIVPWFGGASGTWMVCLAFYQGTLFLGYAYAHGLIRLARPRIQVCVHALMVVAALGALPVLPGPEWAPKGPEAPIPSILAMMTSSVALPFLTLAATGPLVQAWFARVFPGRSPYPLYAVSNVGSLLGLIGYPFLIEPSFSLRAAGTYWAFAFAATAVAVVTCALLAFRRGTGPPQPVNTRETNDATITRTLLWLALSGTAVVLLMGVTNKLCIGIANVPFLWVLPLATYLTTFILCFGLERSYRRLPYLFAMVAILLILDTATGTLEASALLGALWTQIFLYCLLLFSACMLMHGALHRLRPTPRSLTVYYLCVSGGGALGGLFVGILAPTVFDGFHELALGLGLASLLVLAAWRSDPEDQLGARSPRLQRLLVVGLTTIVLFHSGKETFERDDSVLYQERNFFGLIRVKGSTGKQHRLVHGTTLHGVQFRKQPAHRRRPTSYYGVATPIARALEPGRHRESIRVGLVGLGVGTLAVYGRTGDLFRFYEIDPAIIRLATDDDFFSFLGESQASIEIVPGDARLNLMSEYRRGDAPGFDILVLDAFSGASIPVHLLTREAFQIYDAAIEQEGLIAVHISNRHFELWPVIAGLGQELGMHALRLATPAVPHYQSQNATWCFLSRDEAQVRSLIDRALESAKALEVTPPNISIIQPGDSLPKNLRIWTDDYSDLFGQLRWRYHSVDDR